MIYLDNAATTFPKPEEVYKKMDEVNRSSCINAGRGSYKLAREAALLIDETRSLLRKLVHTDVTSDVILSPSITIALYQIIRGIDWKKNDIVYVSPFEHNSVVRTLSSIPEIKIIELPLNNIQEIDIEKMRYMFSKNSPKAVFCTHISNVTGYILPIQDIFGESKKYDAITVLDSAQSLGLIDVNANTSPIDLIAFAGHKTLYGPFGVGGFINIRNIPLKVVITGGTGSDSLNVNMPDSVPSKYEPSSFNLVAIAGLNAALKCLDISNNYKHEKELTDYIVNKIKKLKNIILYVPQDKEKHVGIISFAIEGYKSDEVGMILDEDFDIAVRTGYHCAPLIHKYLNDQQYLGTIRVGLSVNNSIDEADYLIKCIEDLA